MPIDAPYEPSPWEPIATQVEQYESTGGVEGGEMQGAPCVIVSTLGAKSGKQRKTPLIRVEHEGSYAAGATVADYEAHEATGDEKAEWWARATAVWPAYDEYQTKTDRQIPLFVLTPKA
jgi:F420H(2)-dependent quinone reductase